MQSCAQNITTVCHLPDLYEPGLWSQHSDVTQCNYKEDLQLGICDHI